MQVRPYPEDDGRRVWLAVDEQQTLANFYPERPRRELAVRLGLAGRRVSEVIDVTRDDVRPLDGAGVAKLRVTDSKGGDRETVVPNSLTQDLRTVANARGLPQQ